MCFKPYIVRRKHQPQSQVWDLEKLKYRQTAVTDPLKQICCLVVTLKCQMYELRRLYSNSSRTTNININQREIVNFTLLVSLYFLRFSINL